jgi:hypothetical protein
MVAKLLRPPETIKKCVYVCVFDRETDVTDRTWNVGKEEGGGISTTELPRKKWLDRLSNLYPN